MQQRIMFDKMMFDFLKLTHKSFTVYTALTPTTAFLLMRKKAFHNSFNEAIVSKTYK